MLDTAASAGVEVGFDAIRATGSPPPWSPGVGNQPSPNRREREKGMPKPDIDEIRDLLERKLTWYGLRTVRVGPIKWMGNSTLLVDLVDPDGSILDSIEVDRVSGAIRPKSGQSARFWHRCKTESGKLTVRLTAETVGD